MGAAECPPCETDLGGALSHVSPALTTLFTYLQTPPLGTGNPPLSLQAFTLPPQKWLWSQRSGQVHPCFLFCVGALDLFLAGSRGPQGLRGGEVACMQQHGVGPMASSQKGIFQSTFQPPAGPAGFGEGRLGHHQPPSSIWATNLQLQSQEAPERLCAPPRGGGEGQTGRLWGLCWAVLLRSPQRGLWSSVSREGSTREVPVEFLVISGSSGWREDAG